MNFLHQLLNRAGNTLHNDVISPLNRLVNRPQQQPGFTPAPMQTIDLRPKTLQIPSGGTAQYMPNIQRQITPQDQITQANEVRFQAQKQFGLTPSYTQNLLNANPHSDTPHAGASYYKNGLLGFYQPHSVKPSQITLNPQIVHPDFDGSSGPDVLLHEGLHRVWQTNPQVRQQFAKAYDQGNTPQLRQQLEGFLSAYGVRPGQYNLSKIENLPQELQNEAHSFTSEILQYPRIPATRPLTNYYSKYFNPSQARAGTQKRIDKFNLGSSLQNLINPPKHGPLEYQGEE